MQLYSIIMFLVGIPLAGLSIAIYQGKTNLIHDYHRTKVTDQTAYGKAFGKAMSVVSLAVFLSGAVGLLGESEKTVMFAVSVLLIGLAIGIACIVSVQKKFNNGLF